MGLRNQNRVDLTPGRRQLFLLTILLLPALSRPQCGHELYGRALGIRLAASSYLEDAGKLSYMLNELIDQLLEKISFLADMVIESSMDEHCVRLSCKLQEQPQDTQSSDRRLKSAQLDELEYDNSARYMAQLEARMAASESESNGNVNQRCRLFSLVIEKDELPVSDMELCCSQYHECYSRCGSPKLDCDQQFRDCLTQVCRNKFDYTNSNVTSRFRRSILDFDEGESDEDEREKEEEEDEDEEAQESSWSMKRRRETQAADVESDLNSQDIDDDKLNSRESRRLKDKYKACKLANKVLIIGNLAFGCHAYQKAQRLSCCNNRNSSN